MTLAIAAVRFQQDLFNLWEDPDENVTVFQSGDLIETMWSNASVTGLSSATIFPPTITHGPLTPISIALGGTSAGAAAAYELACSTMVLATLFAPIPPAVIIPPPFPVPGGPATPGLLTVILTAIFSVPSPTNTAPQVSNAIAGYLQGWLINVIPVPVPPTVIPTPII